MAKADSVHSTTRRTAFKIKAKKSAILRAEKSGLPTKKQMDDINEKRAKAYADMKPDLCDGVRMGEIAAQLFDDPDQGRFIFAVTHPDDMLQAFRARYYAMDFPA